MSKKLSAAQEEAGKYKSAFEDIRRQYRQKAHRMHEYESSQTAHIKALEAEVATARTYAEQASSWVAEKTSRLRPGEPEEEVEARKEDPQVNEGVTQKLDSTQKYDLMATEIQRLQKQVGAMMGTQQRKHSSK